MSEESKQCDPTSSQNRLALPGGYQLGKYRVDGVLGSGGFGITYLAHDSALHRKVAIKELLPTDIATRVDGSTVVPRETGMEGDFEWALERFVDEGRTLAACEHPAVVHIYDTFEENGTAYLVTKFVEGRDLSKWLKGLGRRPTEEELRALVGPILSGLELVHGKGFLHRDIKPENLFITDAGDPILLDFGSARQSISNRSRPMTSIVTPGYAPFEQYYGGADGEEGSQGAWSDLYALAGVLIRAMTGKKPPEAPSRMGRSGKAFEPLSCREELRGVYSEAFLEAIDWAFAAEPEDRPQSVLEWREAFLKKEAEPERKPGVKGKGEKGGDGGGRKREKVSTGGRSKAGSGDGEKGEGRKRVNIPKKWFAIGGGVALVVVLLALLPDWDSHPMAAEIKALQGMESAMGEAEEKVGEAKEIAVEVENLLLLEPRDAGLVKSMRAKGSELEAVRSAVIELLEQVNESEGKVESDGGRILVEEWQKQMEKSRQEMENSWELVQDSLSVLEPAESESAGMEGSKAGEFREIGGIEMVWCPPGTFLMGSPEDEGDRDDDERQHEVTLTRGFWIAKTECTQGQWESVMGDNPSKFDGSSRLPVERVSWEDLQEWIAKMNKEHPPGEGWEWRLPSEAQWEYACRAGTGSVFAFGDSLGSHQANFDGNYPYGGAAKGGYVEKTTEVGSFEGNEWGLHDMHGNVWEWCLDWYGEYPGGAVTDPSGASDGSFRVYRGGSWHGIAHYCRSANRYRYTPDNRNYSLGFRPVVSSTQ